MNTPACTSKPSTSALHGLCFLLRLPKERRATTLHAVVEGVLDEAPTHDISLERSVAGSKERAFVLTTHRLLNGTRALVGSERLDSFEALMGYPRQAVYGRPNDPKLLLRCPNDGETFVLTYHGSIVARASCVDVELK